MNNKTRAECMSALFHSIDALSTEARRISQRAAEIAEELHHIEFTIAHLEDEEVGNE
jgi:hypothetical protein